MRQSERFAYKKVRSDEPLQPLLSIADVCRMLHLSRPKLHDLIVHEGLPTIKFGRAVRISPTSLQHWLANREEIA
jgi:excisionase family DNA binding protein